MLRPCWLAMLLLASPAVADAIDVSLSNMKVMKGRGAPTVQVAIREPIAGFALNLTRSDGAPFEWKGGGKPGVTRRLEFTQPVGRFTWKGELTVNFPNATTGSIPLEFETVVAEPLKLLVDKDRDVDLTRRSVTFRLSNPAEKAVLKVLMDTGELAFDGEVPFANEAPGTPLTVTWPEAKGRPLKISVTAFDPVGSYVGVEFFPWSFEIPHEDVTFDSGKWDVKVDEQQKLDEAVVKIVDAINRFGRFAAVTLFVAGHTDTVGPTASNRSLSLNRARAIAQFFRKKGVTIPISYEGFGEEALLVATGDETDEGRNRRAQYVIAIEPPLVNARVTPRWQRL